MARELLSDGLAVSYFYNFIRRLFHNLDEASVVYLQGAEREMPYAKVGLEIVLTSILSEENIQKCRDQVFQLPEVHLGIQNGRDMSFFVRANAPNTVVDFPTILTAITELFKMDADQLSKLFGVDAATEDWDKRRTDELSKFKTILEFLIDNDPRTRGKISFRLFPD